jgi:hypothetical protein
MAYKRRGFKAETYPLRKHFQKENISALVWNYGMEGNPD